MTTSWKKCFVNVPLNSDGIREHENWDEQTPNVLTVELSIADYKQLFWLFDEWNKTFGILISLFEEDEIQSKDAKEALRILLRHINESNSSEFLTVAEKIKTAVAKAAELGTPIYLDF